jgi:glycosyltransferase involved in cell wall biosynthesis
MAWCFRNSLGFVMSSRLEACPNLVLEAMANGAVSLSTTHPPMPEIYGETASFYQAGDAEGLQRAMENVASMSPDERHASRQAAQVRAGEFSWSVAADRTIKQLQLALGR